MIKKSPPLGKLLLDKGLISQEALDKALAEQEKSGRLLGRILVREGVISEDALLPVLSVQMGIPWVRIEGKKVDPQLIDRVPATYAHHYKFIPFNLEDGTLSIALADPLDLQTIDDLRLFLGLKIKPFLAGEKEIEKGLKRYYGIGAETVEKIIGQKPGSDLSLPEVATEDIEDLAQDASIIKFVNQILLEAFRERATDIHIEPFQDELRVRYRIDGILYEANVPSNIRYFHRAIVSRIKIMANLNIAERRLPQDGRAKVRVGKAELDLRISILPTPFGEAVDIRLLSTSNLLLGLRKLGLLEKDLSILESVIKRPHGIILVTGPTGSGKTTTLYSCLSRINSSERKIITIEDPIEYQLKGITQIQVLPKIGLTFAQGLRSMLRHDPDIMMVGEIRDFETAEIAIQVALTGHLVFSTVHTNDAASTITRLIDMGVEPYLISSSVELIIAQRLVRLCCPYCKEEVRIGEEFIQEPGIEPLLEKGVVWEGRGCEHCKFTGYRGRTGIYELLLVTDQLRELILKGVPANRIREEALAQGMRTLRQDGFEKVKMGLTTISEVLRVTQQEEG